MKSSRYFVHADDITPYHPANHAGTTNRRLIGPETVGAKKLEVILGVIEKGQGALPHAHPGLDPFADYLKQQVAYWGKLIRAAGIQPE